MKTNTVKAQILDTYNAFSPISRVADVKAEIKGTNYRVKIYKGEVTQIMADKKSVWTPEADVDAITFIDNLVHPVAEKKKAAKEEKAAEKKTAKEEKAAEKKAAKDEKKAAKAKKAAEKKANKVTRKVIDDKWVAHLVEEANKSPELQKGDEIKFRVATSHGKPVCAHIDLYTDDEKLATAGIHHRIGFAAMGIDKRWTDRVDAAIKSIYQRIGSGQMIKKEGAVVKVDDGKIVSAVGTVSAVLSILKTL